MAPFQLKIEKSQTALNNICTDRSKCPFDLISITAWLFSAALNQVPTERQKYGRALALTSYRHYHTNEGASRQNLSASERANKPTTLRRVQCRTLAHAQPFSSSQPGDIWRFTRGRGNYIKKKKKKGKRQHKQPPDDLWNAWICRREREITWRKRREGGMKVRREGWRRETQEGDGDKQKRRNAEADQ